MEGGFDFRNRIYEISLFRRDDSSLKCLPRLNVRSYRRISPCPSGKAIDDNVSVRFGVRVIVYYRLLSVVRREKQQDWNPGKGEGRKRNGN